MRTTEQILIDMDSEQAKIPEAAVLTSKSKTAVFGLLRNIWALFVQSLERNMDTLKAELTADIAAVSVGSLAWYASQVKSFQFGDRLVLINGKPGYTVVDPAKQIVAQVSVIENDGRLLIKTAKINTSAPSYMALNSDEMAALGEYVRQVKYAGVAVDLISLPPDEFRIVATVKYNRQILASNGRMLTQPSRDAVLERITEYVRALPFDSILSWTALTDYMQLYEGILDFVIDQTFIRPAGSTDFTEFRRETVSRAGHVKFIDAAINYV